MAGPRLGAVAALLVFAVAAGAAQRVPPGLRVGSRVPDVRGVDLRGDPVALSDLAGGRTTVLAFWSIYCTDCVRELDDLKAIRREFPADEVTVVAVNTDSGLPLSRIRGFVGRYEARRGPLGVAHLLDRDAAILGSLGVREVPVLAVLDAGCRVTSVHTGYGEGDRPRLARALDEGRVALGAWSEGLRGRVVSVLRGTGPDGAPVEWGSFRVEEGVPLQGLYDAGGWIADPLGRPDRAREAARVEAVAAGRVRVALLREAAASVGLRIPPPDRRPVADGGLRVAENPLDGDGRWRRLYDAVGFDDLYREQGRTAVWVGDRYWVGLVGDVDLGRLRARLAALDVPARPGRLRLTTVSDFDFKVRAVLEALRTASYRVRAVQGEVVVYYGTAEQLADELRALPSPLKVFVEVEAPDAVRLEVF